MGSYEELAQRAAKQLPAAVTRFFAAGAGEELSADEAAVAWRQFRLHPRVLRSVGEPNLSTRILGVDYTLPLGIAPTAMQRFADDTGELAMVRAAGELGAPVCISMHAGYRFEEIGNLGVPWWLQVYVQPDCAATQTVVEAAVAAGASALVLTADAPVVGTKWGIDEAQMPPADWWAVNLTTKPRGQTRWATDLDTQAIAWLKSFGLPVIVKGILRADDARRCAAAGADALWVSNHGGRQLDRSVATASVLEPIRASVGPGVGVFVDGGLRTGVDLLTAYALGADVAFLGRGPLWALACERQSGVVDYLVDLATQLREAMQVAGAKTVSECVGLISQSGVSSQH